jgi:hypothetical protein
MASPTEFEQEGQTEVLDTTPVVFTYSFLAGETKPLSLMTHTRNWPVLIRDGDMALAFGGSYDFEPVLSIDRYTIDADMWDILPASLPFAVERGTGTKVGRQAFVAASPSEPLLKFDLDRYECETISHSLFIRNLLCVKTDSDCLLVLSECE